VPHPAAQAAIIPLDTPEADEADAQRLRADRGELPADGDVTGAGGDRRRRRRGRRGGRRGRGGRGEEGTSDGDAGETGGVDTDQANDDGGA
jgi:ribonuclease E